MTKVTLAHYCRNKILFYAIVLLSTANLIPTHLEIAYRSANLSIPEILGYSMAMAGFIRILKLPLPILILSIAPLH
jgi:hypothetical protein